MKRAAQLFLLLLAACGDPPAPPPKTPAPLAREPDLHGAPFSTVGDECLSIVSWNDLHGQLGPEDAQIDASRVPAGGVIALADRLAAARATGDSVIALDAGDLFTGPIESTLAEGAPIIDAYNVMGVDAAAVGNHEFDFGPTGYDRVVAAPGATDDSPGDGPRGALLARMQSAHFPFVSSNIRRADGKPLGWKPLQRSVHIKRGSWNVGVVGYSTQETPLTTLKPNVEGLDFSTGAAAAVATEVHALRAAGAYPVVLLAHASLTGVLPQQLDDASDPDGSHRTGEIAALIDAMPAADRPDLIIGGHRHQWMLGRVRGIPMHSSDCHGVGLTRTRFCRAGGPPHLQGIERQVSMAAGPPTSALGKAVAESVAPWQAKVKLEADAAITTIPQACPEKAPNGTALAEQVARAIAEHAGAPPPPGTAVVGFINTGGLRAPLRAGLVRYRDLFTTSPFENGVSVCTTTKAGLAKVLANSINVPLVKDVLPFGISGAKVDLKREKDGGLSLRGITLDPPAKRPASDADPVWLVVPDFILWGGDAVLDPTSCSHTVTSQLRVRDAWREVLTREQACGGSPKNVQIAP